MLAETHFDNVENPAQVSFSELLQRNGEDFIRSAFLVALGREADIEGFLFYTNQLKLGIPKIEILLQLRNSDEGIRYKTNFPDLDAAIAEAARRPLQRRLATRASRLYAAIARALRIFRSKASTSVSNRDQLKDIATAVVALSRQIDDLRDRADTHRRFTQAYNIDNSDCLLRPVNDLAPDTTWIATGDDPHFELEFSGTRSLLSGWYKLTLQMATDFSTGECKLYCDNGAGFTESESICLQYNNGIPVSRWFRLRRRAKSIRFDPTDKSGAFRIIKINIEAGTEAQAVDEMLSTLTERHIWYSGKSKTHVAETLGSSSRISGIEFALAVYKAYSSLFAAINAGYENWIKFRELSGLPTAEAVEDRLSAILNPPLISVIVPTFNTPEILLRECLQSVLNQSYPHLELCIADDASTEPHVLTVIREFASRDSRIKLTVRTENGHISRASNSALELATGEFVALLDHDDKLAESALLYVAEAIVKSPNAAILYTDEDKIDEFGRRFEPHFKSDWNPDLILSGNYLSHLGIYRRSLLHRIGGFRTGVEGSQDHDLVLRCLHHVEAAQILHIPKILYHWRAVKGSTADSSGAKSYTVEAARRALNDFFATKEMHGIEIIDGEVSNTYRIRYPIPAEAPLVTLLIPTRDRVDLLRLCVESIIKLTTYTNYEIIILDNESVEPATIEFFEQIQREFSQIRVIAYHAPFNYSAINNFGVEKSNGTVIGLINNDVEVISGDWLTEMVGHVSRPEVGCVGAKLYYPDDTIQHAGVVCGLGGVACHGHKNFPRDHAGYMGRLKLTQTVSAVTGACLLVRRQVYIEVGGLDADNLTVAFNDVDFCLKVDAAGYRNVWTPYAELYHHESVSRGAENTPEKQQRFDREIAHMKRTWPDRLANDPYYNPNLTRGREDFSLN